MWVPALKTTWSDFKQTALGLCFCLKQESRKGITTHSTITVFSKQTQTITTVSLREVCRVFDPFRKRDLSLLKLCRKKGHFSRTVREIVGTPGHRLVEEERMRYSPILLEELRSGVK